MGMNPEIKAQWVRALRSKAYDQGQGSLCYVPALADAWADLTQEERDSRAKAMLRNLKRRAKSMIRRRNDGTKRCCLAVLCDMSVRAGAGVEVTLCDDVVAYDGITTLLPKSVVEWAGIDAQHASAVCEDYDVYVTTDTGRHALSELNDDMHQNFAQIADAIEGDATL